MLQLVSCLDRLAAEPTEQRDYLARLGTWPVLDELALEFDDVVDAYRASVTEDATSALDELDRVLDSMSSDEDAWIGDALTADGRWTKVRALAREALRQLRPVAV